MEAPAAAQAGSLGPRLAGRLTAELILRSPQYMNCIKLYHIDLRGNRIAAIENLGATQNQFDCIDLSDNNVVRLEGFPRLDRLCVLIAHNNRIASIAPGLEKQLPKLDTLVLSNNKLDRLSDIGALASCSKLTSLSVLDNPVSKQKDFRLYTIYRLKSLKVLNFKKVTDKEREAAQEKFLNQTIEQAQQQTAAIAAEQAQQQPKIVTEAAEGATPESTELTEAQKMAIQVAIQNAATLEEVTRLEEALKSGRMPEAAASEVAAMEEG